MSEDELLARVYVNLLHEVNCPWVQARMLNRNAPCECIRAEFRKYITKVKRRK